MSSYDRRLTAARPDLAAEHLRGTIDAERFVTPQPGRISVALADLLPRPDAKASPDTQLLHGERVDIYDQADGWVWVQAANDGYVGYLSGDTVEPAPQATATHRVATLGTNIYSTPSLKTRVTGQLPFGSEVSVSETRDGHVRIGPDQWLPEPHVVPIDHRTTDWVSVAEMFLGVPYLWGGRSNLGLDCSALVQLARQAGGHACLRDSDMQAEREAETLAPDAPLRRGDLIFWRGHVGIMTDPAMLLHANGHHMAVVREPLADAIQRIQAAEDSPVTRRARFAAT